jgi:hypothetical protein
MLKIKPSICFLCFGTFLTLLALGCAMPKQANDLVLTTLPKDWKD